MVSHKTSRGRFRKNVGPVHDQEKVSRAFDGSSNESGAGGDGQQLAKGVAITKKNELLREGNDLRLGGSTLRQASKAGNAGDCAEFLKNDNLNAWSQDDEERKCIVQQILQ